MTEVFTLRGEWVLPIAGPPIRGGSVVVRGEHILSVGHDAEGTVHDFPDSILLPGLVNAHTHLEFSDLTAPIASPGTSFPEWIKAINAVRRGRSSAPSRAVEQGLRESVLAGTTTLGEIETTGWTDGLQPEMEVYRFRELIGLTEPRIGECLRVAEEHLGARSEEPEVRGLSPHAPYTVHPRLLDRAIELVQRHRDPLAMHLAESREELELLSSASGPLRTLLEEAGVWVPHAFSASRRPLDLLERLATAPRTLVIHGNYLADDEIEFLAEHRDTMAVVYCPRTHAYFGHDTYPLQRMLDAGVTVALGTDSRASNPDLSILGEMRQVARSHVSVSLEQIVRLATRNGAAAYGKSAAMGALEEGKLANLAIVVVPAGAEGDPYSALLDPGAKVVQTYHRGRATVEVCE